MVHVAIDARVPNGGAGGVQHVITGLASGFAAAGIPNLKRTWLVYRSHTEWLTPHLPEGDEVLVVEPWTHRVGLAVYAHAPRLVALLRPHVERFRKTRGTNSRGPRLGPLDEELTRRGVQVVHLPFQDGLPTRLPYIYHPHDLQHRYLPHFFTPAQIRHRESTWRHRAAQAAYISVGTRSVARDITSLWGISTDKVTTIPLAPLSALTPIAAPNETLLAAGAPIVLYPASFWPHKNHATLITAAALVRDAGIPLTLLFPGAASGDASTVRKHLARAGFNPDEVMPGFVSDEVLATYYAAATVVAVPSLFEAASFPIWEAFASGTPVIASTVTSLPDQVGDAGLLVDPCNPQEWAQALRRVLTDPPLRAQLARDGLQRLQGYSWDRFALAHTLLYRHMAGEAPRRSEVVALREGPTL